MGATTEEAPTPSPPMKLDGALAAENACRVEAEKEAAQCDRYGPVINLAEIHVYHFCCRKSIRWGCPRYFRIVSKAFEFVTWQKWNLKSWFTAGWELLSI
jgi:hypothetical protein